MLSATEAGVALYSAPGWHPFRGTTLALTPEGVVRTPDEDDVEVDRRRAREERPHVRLA